MALKSKFSSPLRYPGGKARISQFMEDIILLNNLEGCNLYELYAGGAGASLNLLFSGLVNKIILNDLDFHLYSFWYSIVNHSEEFNKLIRDTDINIEAWDTQKRVYDNPDAYSIIDVGFSTFFLNRTNRSGILYKAGPIGGREQKGNYKIDVRFNKTELEQRVNAIANRKDDIEIHNKESLTFIKYIFKKKDKKLLFLDPPYYNQGENLYLNFYDDKDHLDLSKTLAKNKDQNWFLTYDNCPRIQELYDNFRKSFLPMSYTLQNKRKSNEIMMFSDRLFLPKQLRMGIKSTKFELL